MQTDETRLYSRHSVRVLTIDAFKRVEPLPEGLGNSHDEKVRLLWGLRQFRDKFGMKYAVGIV